MEDNRKAYVNNLVTYIGYFLKNGINIDGRKMSFTALDYYSIVKENMNDLASEVRSMTKNNENIVYKGFFLKFAITNGLVFNEITDISKVMNEHYVFILNDKKIVPTEEDVQNIFDLLDNYNIPKYNRIVYIALTRQAFGYPILPFAQMDEKEKSMTK